MAVGVRCRDDRRRLIGSTSPPLSIFACEFLLLFAMGMLHGDAPAQQRILFEHLGVKQGLSQAAVMCSFQDRQGFMWFGTQDGLNRYDGYSIKTFKHDPADPRSLDDGFVTLISEDSSGTLWVGSRGGTLNRFDALTETWTHYPRDSVSLEGARVSAVRSEYHDSFGMRWSGSIGGGLTCLNPRTGAKKTYTHDRAHAGSLADDRVFSVYGDHRGTIWVATHEGLDRFDRETETFTHFVHNDADPGSLSDSWVWPIFEDREGTLWVGTFRGGLNMFDPAKSAFVHFRHTESDPRSLSDERLYSLYQDRSGIIWVGTGDHGVDRFHPRMGAFTHLTHDPADPGSLLDNNIISAFVDRAGTPWIGTRAGLDRLDPSTGKFLHSTHDPSRPGGIGDNMVQSITEDREGMLWLGTVANGLDRFDRTRGIFTHFRHDPSGRPGLSDNRVYALCEDRDGMLWIGTYGGGLNRFDRTNGSWTVFTHNDSIGTSLGAAGVWALCEDHDGVLWIGTYGGGLDRFDPKTESFTHFRHNDGDQQSLSNDLVVTLCEDRTGTLWVGTAGGLNRMDRATGMFRRYREKDGLVNDVILGILTDDHGILWISTDRGLSRFDPALDSFRSYGYNDGLQGDEFNQGAYARNARTGEMYFGGANGITLFHPDSVRQNSYVPPVVLTSFTRYNTDDKEGKPIEEKGASVRRSITLSYKDNIATLEFAALSFTNSFRNQYAYRLEGFSDNWIQLGTDHRATFTNLDGGDYVLRVRGSNNDGVWNEQGTTLGIVVMPPWWKTRWAYGFYFIAVTAFLYGIRRVELNRREQKALVRESELRTKAVEAEKRTLEAENERKTKELEDARTLQLSMLPREVPQIPGYDIAVFMKTATEVGGDYYDFALAPDGSLTIAFGDATGHGMQAGTIVTLMKGLFLSDASRADIQSFFRRCSTAIKEIRLGRLFMAFTLVRLRGSSLSLSSAGMPPVYLHRKSGGSIEEIFLKGMPLGAMKSFPYGLHETELQTGDTVLLVTDGLPEQKNSRAEMFDYSRVEQVLTQTAALTPAEIIARLVAEGERWMKGALQEDDITLLVIRKT